MTFNTSVCGFPTQGPHINHIHWWLAFPALRNCVTPIYIYALLLPPPPLSSPFFSISVVDLSTCSYYCLFKVGGYYTASMFPIICLIWDLSTEVIHRNSDVQSSRLKKLTALLYSCALYPNLTALSSKSGISKEALRGTRTTWPSHQVLSTTIVHISQHFQRKVERSMV